MNVPSTSKPWESSNGYYYSSQIQAHPPQHALYSAPVPFPTGPGGGGGGGNFLNGVPSIGAQPPPVPPRPSQTRPIYTAAHNTRNLMQPSYSPYANYSSYYQSPYSNFNTFRYGTQNRMQGYLPTSMNNEEEPTIAELAQESSASAFQSIQSFVSTFTSISTMLESTFHAVYSSFRAVVEVADHLGKVKQVFQTLAVFRFLRWMLRRISYLIGISKIKPEQIEAAWNSVLLESGKGSDWAEKHFKPKDKSPWPILAFLGFMLAGPYLVWKLIAALNYKQKAPTWSTGEGEHVVAISEYDFDPESKNELRLRKGSRIRLAPASHQPEGIKGWILASDAGRIGLVPVNYIKVMGKGHATPVPSLPEARRIAGISIPEFVNSASSQTDPLEASISSTSSPSMSRSSSQSTLVPN